MAWKVTKRGSLDNEIANEIFCDTEEDRAKIPASEINLGTVAVVIENMQVYIANSKKEWKNFAITPTTESEETEEQEEENQQVNPGIGGE